MNVRVPKDYHQMTPAQKKRIEEYIVEVATQAARKQEEHDCRVILDLYMKMVCCMLHDSFGFGEKRLNYFMGNHKRVFARQNKLVDRGEQLAYLNKRMDEIFKKNGFPQRFIDDIIGEVEIVDAKEVDDGNGKVD
jgi:hypothetical protein